MAMTLMEIRNRVKGTVESFEHMLPDSAYYDGKPLTKVDEKTGNMKLAYIKSYYPAAEYDRQFSPTSKKVIRVAVPREEKNKYPEADMYYIDDETGTYTIEHEEIVSDEISKIMNEEATSIIITEGNQRLYTINYSDEDTELDHMTCSIIDEYIRDIKDFVAEHTPEDDGEPIPDLKDLNNKYTILKYNDGKDAIGMNDEYQKFIPWHSGNCAEMEYAIVFVKMDHAEGEEPSGEVTMAGVNGIMEL